MFDSYDGIEKGAILKTKFSFFLSPRIPNTGVENPPL